jgi:hypothetical protein
MTALETETGNAFLSFFGRFLFLGSQKRHFFGRFWVETAYFMPFLGGNGILNYVSAWKRHFKLRF